MERGTDVERQAAPASVGQPILAVEGVTKRFGPNEVLKNVTLSLDAQEIRAICGENGAGKSTLVKVCTGVHQADGGTAGGGGIPGRGGGAGAGPGCIGMMRASLLR